MTEKKKLLVTNGLRGRLENCLPINTTSMFACLKYQIVLWSVGNSCSGCIGVFSPGLQSPGTFCPTRSGWRWAWWRHGARAFIHDGLAPIRCRVSKKEPPAALGLCVARRALIRKGTLHCGSPQQRLIASQVGPQTWHLLALGFGWTIGLAPSRHYICCADVRYLIKSYISAQDKKYKTTESSLHVWARHWGLGQSHGRVIFLQPITVAFPLKGRCGIGFDLSTSQLRRSCPVKASSGVTLMTSPQGCHESVCPWPALPRSVCVKVPAVCPHAAAVFVYWKNPFCFTSKARSAKWQPLDNLSSVVAQRRWQIVSIGRRAVDAGGQIASTWCRVAGPEVAAASPRFSPCGTGQRGQQGWAGRLATWRRDLGDQWGEHGGHAERGGPEQDQEHQDAASAGVGEVRRPGSHSHPTGLFSFYCMSVIFKYCNVWLSVLCRDLCPEL